MGGGLAGNKLVRLDKGQRLWCPDFAQPATLFVLHVATRENTKRSQRSIEGGIVRGSSPNLGVLGQRGAVVPSWCLGDFFV
jgi:hypothetical protein